jgi:2-polyprenyl-3-methyl-5-hydroxy-6-metoxy-1,4-benzoquinol methylase
MKNFYTDINEAIWKCAKTILNEITNENNITLSDCIDIGCGPGWFANELINFGLKVIGIDARMDYIISSWEIYYIKA